MVKIGKNAKNRKYGRTWAKKIAIKVNNYCIKNGKKCQKNLGNKCQKLSKKKEA